MHRLALILPLLLAPLAPAAADDWTPNHIIMTGPVFPLCHVGLGRVWKEDGPAASPVHFRIRNNNERTTRLTWVAEMVTVRGQRANIGTGVITIGSYDWGTADTLPVNPMDARGSRIVVTFNACTPG